MNDDTKELTGHLMRNAAMWQQWQKHGFKGDSLTTVNFHFFCKSKSSLDELISQLDAAHIIYRVNARRSFLILKQWDIEADVTQQWSFDDLQAKTGMMLGLAKKSNCSLEGCGALISDK
jgi:Regulator of ribonuclease activity B